MEHYHWVDGHGCHAGVVDGPADGCSAHYHMCVCVCVCVSLSLSSPCAQTYFASAYYLYCPAVPSSPTYTMAGTCNGTITDSSLCLLTCKLPYARVAGGSKRKRAV